MLLLALAAAAAAPQPGEIETFRDWTVGCDNTRACKTVSLLPEDKFSDDIYGALGVEVTRDAGPIAPVRLAFDLQTQLNGEYVIAIDGRPVARQSIRANTQTVLFPAATTAALLAAMLRGQILALHDRSGKTVGRVSLAGLSASLRYIDDRQGRGGSTSALVAKGARTSAPLAATLPTVTVPPPTRRAPRTLSPAAAARLIGDEAAVCDYAGTNVKPEARRLDARTSLVLVNHPCGNGAYNFFSTAFLVDERGRATRARFDGETGMGLAEDSELVNPGWENGELTTYSKGRGLGDCGSSSRFVWDGARFRMIELRAMGECRGSVNWIPVWRARVVRR